MLENKLHLLDPNNILERGYAIITQQDKIISSVNNLDFNTNMVIKLKDGVISAYPDKISERDIKYSTEVDKIEKILK